MGLDAAGTAVYEAKPGLQEQLCAECEQAEQEQEENEQGEHEQELPVEEEAEQERAAAQSAAHAAAMEAERQRVSSDATHRQEMAAAREARKGKVSPE
mgnify:CR=1 FL=1